MKCSMCQVEEDCMAFVDTVEVSRCRFSSSPKECSAYETGVYVGSGGESLGTGWFKVKVQRRSVDCVEIGTVCD